MTDLADAVLPLIPTRADLHKWSASDARGRQMHEAVHLLEQAVTTQDPATVFSVRHKALASAIKVIARADDSSGIIGDAAAWLEDTADALKDIGEFDLAIDWPRQATEFDRGHHSLKAADHWCKLPAEHRPDELLDARLTVFHRWPSSSTAAYLYRTPGKAWPDYRDEVAERLAASPRDAALFALLSLNDIPFAWNLAHSLALDSNDVWQRLAKAYEKVDPLAVLPVLTRLVEEELTEAGAHHYQLAARRLKKMRELSSGIDKAGEVDTFVAELREVHRRRPRLQQEFDRAGLP